MALSAAVELLNTIPEVVLCRNKIPLKLQASTNLIENEDAVAEIILDWNAIADPDDNFDLQLFGQTVTFTCKAAPDNSGMQFHDGSGSAGLVDWVELLATDLRRNYLIARYYTISVGGSELTIRANESGSAYSLEYTAGIGVDVTVTDDNKTGINLVLRAFYGIVILLYCNDYFVSELVLNVDEEGIARTDISEYLKPYLNQILAWPEPDTDFIFDCPGAVAIWSFQYGERWGSLGYQAMSWSDTYYVIDAGVSRMQLLNYFLNETDFWQKLQNNLCFLSWAPLTRIIGPEEPVKLYFMNHSGATGLFLKAKLYAETESTITVDSVDATDKAIYEMILSPAKVGYTGLSDQSLVKIEVWVEDQTDAIISEIRTFILDYTSYEHTRYFIFKNSLGAFECLRTTGLMQKSGDVARETATLIGDNELDWAEHGSTYAIKDREELSVSNIEQQKFSVAMGWLSRYANSEEYRNWLRDFTLSTEVFQVIGNTIKPIRLTGSSFDYGKDRDSVAAFAFEFVNAFRDENFTKEITGNLLDETYSNELVRAQ